MTYNCYALVSHVGYHHSPSKQLLHVNKNTFYAVSVTTTLLFYLWFGKAAGCLFSC
jgi:hypothetical protein